MTASERLEALLYYLDVLVNMPNAPSLANRIERVCLEIDALLTTY